MGKLVYLEGPIGVGKSTFVREMAPRLNYRAFAEPVDKAHLDRFYADPKRYAWNLQIHLLHRRIGLQRLAACESLYSDRWDGVLIDRSVFGDAIFERMHYENGNISTLDHETYRAALLGMKLDLFPPTLLIYLDAKPETCLARIRERAKREDRPYEAGITVEYLRDLSAHYEDLLRTARDGKWPWGHCVDVVRLPWDEPLDWDTVAETIEPR